jgi:hypothetical protein
MLRDRAADETLRTERRTALVSPLDKPLEQANGEDSQEEPDQEVSEMSENGDELVDTIQIENVLRALSFKEDVSARDQNAKGSHRQQEQVQVKFYEEPDRIAGVGDSIRPERHLPVHRELTGQVPFVQSSGRHTGYRAREHADQYSQPDLLHSMVVADIF